MNVGPLEEVAARELARRPRSTGNPPPSSYVAEWRAFFRALHGGPIGEDNHPADAWTIKQLRATLRG